MVELQRESGTGGGADAADKDAALRESVIAAADDLFYGRGIQSVGMDDVRQASGVSLKKLYSLFSSKERLVLAVLARRHGMWTDGVTARVDAETDPRLRLLAIYDYLSEWFADDSFRGCGFINSFGELGVVTPAVAEYTRDHKESFQRYVAELVEQAGAPEELAPQLAILAEGAQTTAAIAGTGDAAVHARRAAEVLIDVATSAS